MKVKGREVSKHTRSYAWLHTPTKKHWKGPPNFTLCRQQNFSFPSRNTDCNHELCRSRFPPVLAFLHFLGWGCLGSCRWYHRFVAWSVLGVHWYLCFLGLVVRLWLLFINLFIFHFLTLQSQSKVEKGINIYYVNNRIRMEFLYKADLRAMWENKIN